MLCSYGCGNDAIKTFKNGNHCCSEFVAKCPEVRRKNKLKLKTSYKEGQRQYSAKLTNCLHCNKLISIRGIKQHERSCKENPIHKKLCPICKKVVNRGCVTCSQECRYILFGGPNKIEIDESNDYRKICFYYHDKRCIICDEENVVEVHHFDENHNNNQKENLIPLCPTHHKYMHSEFKELIIGKVVIFILNQYKYLWE